MRAFVSFIFLAVLAPSVALADDLAGSFVGGGARFTVLLQILPAGQGRVVGRLRETSIDEKGRRRVFDKPLNGAVSSDTFVGKLEASWDAGGDVAISGHMTGGYLLVTSANGLKVALRKGEEAEFNRAVELLGQQSANIQQQAAQDEASRKSARALAETASQISTLRKKIAEFSKLEPQQVESQATAAQRYLVITQRMRGKLSQLQQEVQPTGDGEGRRSSLGADIYHLSIDASHIHIDVQKAQSNFEVQAGRLLRGTGAADGVCRKGGGTGVDDSVLRSECTLVPTAMTTLSQASTGVRTGYAILEKAWVRERGEQEDILRVARDFMRQHSLRP